MLGGADGSACGIGRFFLGFIALMVSNVGRNISGKTDSQLYDRYSRYLDHRRRFELCSNGWVKVNNEIQAMASELRQRGYDIDKLMSEETDAKWEGRPIDFARCRTVGKDPESLHHRGL